MAVHVAVGAATKSAPAAIAAAVIGYAGETVPAFHDPVVLVAAVGAAGATLSAWLNSRVLRTQADILALRVAAEAATERAKFAEQRASDAAERLAALDEKLHLVMRKFTILEVWSVRVVDEMHRHGLNPPERPE